MAFTTAEVNAWFQTIDGLPPTTVPIATVLSDSYVGRLNAGTATPVVIQATLENFPINNSPPPTNIPTDLFYRTSVAQFVLREFQAAWGAVPTTGAGSQFDNWVARIIANPGLENGGMSLALAGTSQFMTEYGVTSATQPASIGFINLLAANLGVAVGPGALLNVGLPVWQVLQNFVSSQGVIASLEAPIANFQNQLLAGTNIPGSIFSQPGLPSETFTLTNGQDTISAHGEIIVNGPLSGPFGNQPTLTSGDSITNSGIGSANSVLNATFAGGHNVFGVNIDAIPTWNFQQTAGGGGGTVNLSGGILGADNTITGLSTLRYNDNGFGDSLNIGTAALPILPGISGTFDGFALTVANASGTAGSSNHAVDIAMSAAGFSSAGQAITVTAAFVGNTGTDFDSSYGLAAGSPTGAGFTTWTLNSIGGPGNTNDLRLGADGSTSATTLNVTDDGSGTILWAAGSVVSGSSAANWENLATISAGTTTGALTITGGESGSEGLLSDNTTALTSVTGGTGADLFDLSSSAWADVTGVSIVGGGNAGTVVELSNSEINLISGGTAGAFLAWTGIPTLNDVASDTVGGPINMAEFPGTLTVNLLDTDSGPSPDQSAAIDVTNAPNNFTFNFNDTDQLGNDFSIIGIGGVGDTVNVDYGAPNGSTGEFVSQNIDNVIINVTTPGAFDFYGDGVAGHTGIEAVANDGSAEVLTINTAADLFIGEFATPTVGTSSLTLIGGTLLDPTNGTLDINGTGSVAMGVTNAITITDTSTTGALEMFAPGNDIVNPLYTGIDVTAAAPGSILSGTVGPETLIPVGLGGGGTAFTAIVGSDTLTDTAGGSKFWGDGGSDTLNMGGGGNVAFFGYILAGETGPTFQNQLITNNTDAAYQGFWGVGNGTGPTAIGASTSASNTTINGFSLTGGDSLSFNVNAWAGANAGTGSLVNGDGHTVVTGGAIPGTASTMEVVDVPGSIVTPLAAGTNVVLDDLAAGGFANATDLAHSLTTAAGALEFAFSIGGGVHAHTSVHMLVAYATDTPNTLEVADVDFVNSTGASVFNTTGLTHVFASDMVKLVGVGSLNDLDAHPGAILLTHHA